MPDDVQPVAAVIKTSIKPYKLKPSGETLSRDDLATWKEVLLSHMRQNEVWKQFLPGGARAEWKASDDAEDNNWTADVTAAFEDFITCLATFSPAGFNETVKRESTSVNWVIDLMGGLLYVMSVYSSSILLRRMINPKKFSKAKSLTCS